MNDAPATGGAPIEVDREHPWLGLHSYSEDTIAYFHGRDEETGELCRRVQRKLLTVLFGQSGLGKTSLLRAGIVPRLRREDYCPIYVRVDYAPDSPAPSEQIKQAILRATAAAGHWTRPGSAIEGESLWEFMHHRGDLLRDASGRTLTPLLIFDQFEEVFTLGQADDAGRRRAQQYLSDLADLVENRPPAALEARIEDDDAAAEDFDFARADYRVLIALREDYLAHLEGVKAIMPSITQNRMRLARMTGAQALSAVVKPGGKLVSQEVAESIVRFVAGGSELQNAEIEPSLLSLVCRELNNTRVAQGRDSISADLLAGSRDTILSEFYERTLADQPPGVRRVIEDELLTESGHRESLAQERVAKALAAAGASPEALATLVDRRLLRVEDRLDMRRVELTHDVLCPVVLASRNLRQANEAREAAERQLAEQREREAATHRALVRARTIATVCAVMMVVAIAGALFGFINLKRAKAADAEAQKARQSAERARGEAEKLIGFLIEDFYAELEPTGRLDTLGKLAHMTVGYYDGLPPELVTPRTRSFRAMALVREAAALNAHGDANAAFEKFAEAQAVFEQLRAAGDQGEEVAYGLALALQSQGITMLGGGRGTPEQLKRAIELLRPFVDEGKASVATKLLFAMTLNVYSHHPPKEVGVAICEEARKVLAGIGALDLSNLNAAATYADTADSQARHLLSLGRLDEAQKLEEEVYALTEKILQQRPNDFHALSDRYFSTDMLGVLAARRGDLDAALRFARDSARAGEDYVRFDPSDLTAWGYWIRGLSSVADTQYEQGDLDGHLATLRAMIALNDDPRRPSSVLPQLGGTISQLIFVERQLGLVADSDRHFALGQRAIAEGVARFPEGNPGRALTAQFEAGTTFRMLVAEGRDEEAIRVASGYLAALEAIKLPPNLRSLNRQQGNMLRGGYVGAAATSLRLGRGEDAERHIRAALAIPPDPTADNDPADDTAAYSALLGAALALQGREDEARTVLEPVLAHYAERWRKGMRGTTLLRNYATAQYASGLAAGNDPPRRAAALREAARLLDSMSPSARRLSTHKALARRIEAARVNGPG